MSDLRSKVIRLAHARPDLRPALLPLLKESAPRVAGKPHEWLLNNPEANRLFNAILGEARKVDWEPYMERAAVKILEGEYKPPFGPKVDSVDTIPSIWNERHPRGIDGVPGDWIQNMYENKKNPYSPRRLGTLNVMLENPRIKRLIDQYIEAAEKTGVSADEAADQLDERAYIILADSHTPKIFMDLDVENSDAIARAVEEVKENDPHYQDQLAREDFILRNNTPVLAR